MNPPRNLYVELYQGCNLKCEHCLFWQRQDRRSFTAEQRAMVLDEYAEMSPGGAVISCGGEATIAMSEYFDVTMRCIDLGLRCLSVTNGTHVTDRNAARFVEFGPAEITVSIDSHDPAKHDQWRGVQGSHAAALRALRLLLAARKTSVRKPKIFAMTIVAERSYRDLPAIHELMLGDVGVDRLKLNQAQPTFGLANGNDEWFERNAIADVPGLRAILDECNAKWGRGMDPEWADQVEMHFRSLNVDVQRKKGWLSPGRHSEHICNSYERNIMIDGQGLMRLCFNPSFPGKTWKQPGDLRAFWEGATHRGDMEKCNRYCGISHSVRKTAATIGVETGT